MLDLATGRKSLIVCVKLLKRLLYGLRRSVWSWDCYDWGGLYEIFKRVSCWCCPLQSLPELKKLREHYPELWAKLREMDDSTWRTFKEDYSVRRLEVRFDLENLFVTYGKSPRCREFFRTLNFLMDGKEVS